MFQDLQKAVDQLTESADAEAVRVFKKSHKRENHPTPFEQRCLADGDTEQLLESVRALMEKQLVFNQAMAAVKTDQNYTNLISELDSELKREKNERNLLEQIKHGLHLLSKSKQSTDDFLELLEKYQARLIETKVAEQDKQDIQNTASRLLAQYKEAHETIEHSETYTQLFQAFESGTFSKDDLAELKTLVQNAKEDYQGAVRVFVRIRAGELKNNAFVAKVQGEKVCHALSEATLCGKQVCDPLYMHASQIFLPDATTDDMFTHRDETQPESITELCTRLAQGNMGNLVLFGYGYSGSGKTFTLLGDGLEKQGLFQLAVKTIQESIGENNIEFGCKECYLENLDDPQTPRKPQKEEETAKAKAQQEIASTRTRFYSYNVANETIQLQDPAKLKAKTFKYTDQNNLAILLKLVAKARKRTFRVKWTPNNPESSRSHLLFTAKFMAVNKKPRVLAVLDLAGLEDSNFIFDNMIDEFKITQGCNLIPDERLTPEKRQVQEINMRKAWFNTYPEYKPPSTQRGDSYKTQLMKEVMINFKTSKNERCNRFDLVRKEPLYTKEKNETLDLRTQIDRYRYIWQLIDEGFFINATIKELADYLKDMKKNPKVQNGRNFGKTGFCDILDALRDGDHPAKFIMICTINAQKTMNTEEKSTGKQQANQMQPNTRDNCKTDITKTIEFLNSIQKTEPQNKPEQDEEKKEEGN